MILPLLDTFFDKNIIGRSKISTIFYVDDNRLSNKNKIQNLGHYLQYKYEMINADVITFSGNHCANIEFAISYAESLIKSGEITNVLILTANKVLDIKKRIIGNYAIEGDGAGIIFLNNDLEDGIAVLAKYSYTTGILHEADLTTENSFLLCKNYLECISEFLKRKEIKPNDIDNIVIQNANYLLINQCLNSLGFKNNQLFLENINKYGHLGCVDFIVNMSSLNKQNINKTNIISFGTGWAGSNICLLMSLV